MQQGGRALQDTQKIFDTIQPVTNTDSWLDGISNAEKTMDLLISPTTVAPVNNKHFIIFI